MSAESKRITFIVTPETEEALIAVQKELFYDSTRSDMIRELIALGLKISENEKSQPKSSPKEPCT